MNFYQKNNEKTSNQANLSSNTDFKQLNQGDVKTDFDSKISTQRKITPKVEEKPVNNEFSLQNTQENNLNFNNSQNTIPQSKTFNFNQKKKNEEVSNSVESKGQNFTSITGSNTDKTPQNNVPKTFAKKPATMKKSNIFENEAVDFYEIPEIKGHQNHDKSTKIYDNSYQDNSNEINLPNKSENSINKIEKNEQKTNVGEKLKNLKMNAEKKDNEPSKIIDSDGKNNFFDDFDFN